MATTGSVLGQIEAELRSLRIAIAQEPWKEAHDSAMRCREFEQELRDSLPRLESVLHAIIDLGRNHAKLAHLDAELSHLAETVRRDPHLAELAPKVESLFVLSSSTQIEMSQVPSSFASLEVELRTQIHELEGLGFQIEGAEAVRQKLMTISDCLAEIYGEVARSNRGFDEGGFRSLQDARTNDPAIAESSPARPLPGTSRPNQSLSTGRIAEPSAVGPTAAFEPPDLAASSIDEEPDSDDLYPVLPSLPLPGPGVRIQPRIVDRWPIDPPITWRVRE